MSCLLVVLTWYGVLVGALLRVVVLPMLDMNDNRNRRRTSSGIIKNKTRDI
jgi:hypothetical protein